MKARKQGNALVLSIPTKLNVQEGTEYMVMKEEDGSLIFTPKGPDIFTQENASKTNLRPDEDEFDNELVGREKI